MTLEGNTKQTTEAQTVSNEIFTVANVVSFIRLCLVPAYLVLLFKGYDIMAAALFTLAACTDWVDGQIARRTNTVSRLGQLLDPAVDRILVISAVIALLLVGRLPFWIILIIVLRDGFLLLGGAVLLRRFRIRIPVVFAGKVSTALLFIGFVGLLFNWPLIPGLGVTHLAWLPGFNYEFVSWGIWFVYVGMVLSLIVACYYAILAINKVRAAKQNSDRAGT